MNPDEDFWNDHGFVETRDGYKIWHYLGPDSHLLEVEKAGCGYAVRITRREEENYLHLIGFLEKAKLHVDQLVARREREGL